MEALTLDHLGRHGRRYGAVFRYAGELCIYGRAMCCLADGFAETVGAQHQNGIAAPLRDHRFPCFMGLKGPAGRAVRLYQHIIGTILPAEMGRR